MKSFSLLAAILALGCTLTFGDAEAASKRFGGGKSAGMQRQATTPAPAAAPSQAAAPSSAAASAAGAAQPKRSWMGPLAGLAAGLGLAALASHFGFGEELASMLMIGLLVLAVMVVIGLFLRRRAAARDAAGPAGLQYAATGAGSATPTRRLDEPLLPASSAAAATEMASKIPADFDAEGFVRNAKVSFIRLQAANDVGNLDDIREFTTPEMFAEISLNLADRGKAVQETEVVTIDAEVLEVAEEATRYIVSLRFRGLIREDKEAAAEPIDEIWHMVKPRDGKGGWVVAGIQQTL
ncbi:MAG: Tim44 domain-containing protein [Candidatus Accumulibacter sp.]|nr:Tim44 domain-containing protein [Accumulibacter sp.]